MPDVIVWTKLMSFDVAILSLLTHYIDISCGCTGHVLASDSEQEITEPSPVPVELNSLVPLEKI